MGWNPFSSSSKSDSIKFEKDQLPDAAELKREVQSLTKTVLSNPIAVGLISAGGTALALALHWRYTRRIKNAEYLTPAVIKWRKMLVGRVTSVGDADGFRLYHTPGPPFLRDLMYRTPKTASALKDNTLSVRLAGADAPEAAHFGHEAQPFSKEAKDRLKQLVEGRTVWVEVSHVDQYKRLVGTPYVWASPYILGRTNVSLALIKDGLASVYTATGAAYGSADFWARLFSKAKSGRAKLERAEKRAKAAKRGMWSLGSKLETPDVYKRRTREMDKK